MNTIFSRVTLVALSTLAVVACAANTSADLTGKGGRGRKATAASATSTKKAPTTLGGFGPTHKETVHSNEVFYWPVLDQTSKTRKFKQSFELSADPISAKDIEVTYELVSELVQDGDRLIQEQVTNATEKTLDRSKWTYDASTFNVRLLTKPQLTEDGRPLKVYRLVVHYVGTQNVETVISPGYMSESHEGEAFGPFTGGSTVVVPRVKR